MDRALCLLHSMWRISFESNLQRCASFIFDKPSSSSKSRRLFFVVVVVPNFNDAIWALTQSATLKWAPKRRPHLRQAAAVSSLWRAFQGGKLGSYPACFIKMGTKTSASSSTRRRPFVFSLSPFQVHKFGMWRFVTQLIRSLTRPSVICAGLVEREVEPSRSRRIGGPAVRSLLGNLDETKP